MNYSTEQEDYLMTTPYTKKIQKNLRKLRLILKKMDLIPLHKD